MSCEIIQFSAAARPARKGIDTPAAAEVTVTGHRVLTPRQMRRAGRPELPPSATETAKNSRLRLARRDVWWHAGQVADYWQARMVWHHALSSAQSHGIADSRQIALENKSRFAFVDKWREAIAKQLLTPAPDLAAITWKRAKLTSSDFPYVPVKKERVEQAIDDDVAFLATHPTRRAKQGGSS